MLIFPFINLCPHTRQGSPEIRRYVYHAQPGVGPAAEPASNLPEEPGSRRGGTGQSEEVWPSAVSVRSLGGAAAAAAAPGAIAGRGGWTGG